MTKCSLSTKSIVYKSIPEPIKQILLVSEGWLVGNSLTQILKGEEVKDFDIIVPSRELFQVTTKLLNNYLLSINSYGGLKVNYSGLTIDIWCEELSHFLMTANKVGYTYNYKRNILLENLK